MMDQDIAMIMEQSGVSFGTSGARGLVTAMTDQVCYSYTRGFIQHLEGQGGLQKGTAVAVAGDYRQSSGRIMAAVGKAIEDCGYSVVNAGFIPSPAVAYYGLVKSVPAIMVTGSHIPDDRNGIKFNKATGEINKSDEQGIKKQMVSIEDTLFNAQGMFATPYTLPNFDSEAQTIYISRYSDFFGSAALKGCKLGLYEHSTVGREEMYSVLTALGADVTKLGFSDAFMPVDTEAIRPQDVELAQQWASEHSFDAIVSADGDCDRPLLSDENGVWFRGDVLGVLCSEYLKADAAATPVSCNTVAEKSGVFTKVERTRIGSPYVIAGMESLEKEGYKSIVGYEANGGFLTQSELSLNGAKLSPLPTRDALLPIIVVIILAKEKKKQLSNICSEYPERFTASDRLKEFPQDKSKKILAQFSTGNESEDIAAIENLFKDLCGNVDTIDRTDGLRITFKSGEIVHLRPSGNAPEFRCYAEADTEERSVSLTEKCLKILKNT